jgi:hypothetical protein
MLMESSIPVAPLERSRAPNSKHMAPATNDMRSRLRCAEPLPQVIEDTDDTSSQEDADNDEDNDADGDSEHDEGGENGEDENGEDENSEDENGKDEDSKDEDGEDEDNKDENDSNNNNGDNDENDSGGGVKPPRAGIGSGAGMRWYDGMVAAPTMAPMPPPTTRLKNMRTRMAAPTMRSKKPRTRAAAPTTARMPPRR